ncbi:MAG TPA: Bax inhibitor-1/YccA family protein [bacterium]|jgi:uncharacterized YccA/Bax inhibitor family protein
MRTANPALNEKAFQDASLGYIGDMTMTVNGAINKTFALFFLLLAGAFFTWSQFFNGNTGLVMILFWVGLIGGLIFALITIFAKTAAPFTAPAYAAFEGLLLGGLSAILESVYQGIVLQAVGLTFGVLFVMLTIYRTGIIKVTNKFRTGVIIATGSVMLVYMATWILGFFGVAIPYIHGSGLIGIGFSLVVIFIACLNLILDFDFFEMGERARAPKYMEWYAAFGLIVTLVWLYIEILRLLSKLRSR